MANEQVFASIRGDSISCGTRRHVQAERAFEAAVIQTKSDAERMLNQRVVAIMREAEQKIRAAEDEVKTWVDT